MLHKISFLQVLLIVGVIFSSSLAYAATFTVDSIADSVDLIPGDGVCATADNQCTLRAAIMEANHSNNPGLDNIEFDIVGPCPQTIQPLSALPNFTSPVNINGYTQPGSAVATASSLATLCIEISGVNTTGNGLTLGNGSSGSTIRGLSINRFTRFGGGTGHAISINQPPGTSDSGSNWIAGNYLNVAPDGVTVFNGPWGAGLNDGGIGHNIIGHDPLGPNHANPAADQNVISGAGAIGSLLFAGIQIFIPAEANEIRGNYIGTDASGTVDLGNPGSGIRSETGKHLIEGNLISGNDISGIFLLSGDNMIRGNKIGTDMTGTVALGNSANGIHVLSANNIIRDNLISGNKGNHGVFLQNNLGQNLVTGNRLGTDVSGTAPLGNRNAGVACGFSSNNRIEGNIIAFNSSNGVGVANSISNAILSNSIFNNNKLGIDLFFPPPPAPDGVVNQNDDGDVDGGPTIPNNLQNFPVIDVADSFLNPPHVQVRVRLDSKPSQDYLIQGFLSPMADPSGHGEGKKLVAQKTVSIDSSGHVDFRLPVSLKMLPEGSIFTVTATDLLTNDTSEFSKWENLDDVQDVRGSPTAYEHAAGAVGGDGWSGMSWEEQGIEPMPEEL